MKIFLSVLFLFIASFSIGQTKKSEITVSYAYWDKNGDIVTAKKKFPVVLSGGDIVFQTVAVKKESQNIIVDESFPERTIARTLYFFSFDIREKRLISANAVGPYGFETGVYVKSAESGKATIVVYTRRTASLEWNIVTHNESCNKATATGVPLLCKIHRTIIR